MNRKRFSLHLTTPVASLRDTIRVQVGRPLTLRTVANTTALAPLHPVLDSLICRREQDVTELAVALTSL